MLLERPSIMRAPVGQPSPGRRSRRADPVEQLDVFNAWEGVAHNFPLLTVDETARELNCSERHIRNFIAEGKMIAFPINAETQPKRRHFCILRSTAASAFQFVPSAQRLQAIHDAIATVDTWLFKPFSDDPAAHWLGCLKIGQRASLTVLETAAALRCAASHVRDLHKLNQLAALDIASAASSQPQPDNLKPDNLKPPQYLRIHRPSLVTFVQIRLARQNNIDL